MDIFGFISGIEQRQADFQSVKRASEILGKEVGAGNTTSYLAEALELKMPGGGFEDYFFSAFLPRFHDTSESFIRHCILNFAVQQLAVRAFCNPHRENYFFCGGLSVTDFGASLLNLRRVLTAVILARKGEGGALLTAAREMLRDAPEDDIKDASVREGDEPLQILGSEPDGTCGLLIMLSNERLKFDLSALHTGKRILSEQGTMLLSFPPSLSKSFAQKAEEAGYSRSMLWSPPAGMGSAFGGFVLGISGKGCR